MCTAGDAHQCQLRQHCRCVGFVPLLIMQVHCSDLQSYVIGSCTLPLGLEQWLVHRLTLYLAELCGCRCANNLPRGMLFLYKSTRVWYCAKRQPVGQPKIKPYNCNRAKPKQLCSQQM